MSYGRGLRDSDSNLWNALPAYNFENAAPPPAWDVRDEQGLAAAIMANGPAGGAPPAPSRDDNAPALDSPRARGAEIPPILWLLGAGALAYSYLNRTRVRLF